MSPRISPFVEVRDAGNLLVRAGFALTGHFLEQFVFNPLNRPLPPARVWMLDKLGEAGRL